MIKLDSNFFSKQWVQAITAEFGAVGQLTVIHLFTSIFESPGQYWRSWTQLDRRAFPAQVPGLTVEVLDAIIERLVSYDVVSAKMLDRKVLTSAFIQREYIKQVGLARARRLQWQENACLSLKELLDLGIVPAETDASPDEPVGVVMPLNPIHPYAHTGWRRVRLRGGGAGLHIYKPIPPSPK